MLLENKIAVIYGGGGTVGGAVARAFAREGARVFLTGRNLSKVDAGAQEIIAEGGEAESAAVDALDEHAIDRHLRSVIDKADRVDISFNAIGIPNPKTRAALVELDVEQFSMPIATYTRSYFLTARLAARYMVPNKSGVIMTVTGFRAGERSDFSDELSNRPKEKNFKGGKYVSSMHRKHSSDGSRSRIHGRNSRGVHRQVQKIFQSEASRSVSEDKGEMIWHHEMI